MKNKFKVGDKVRIKSPHFYPGLTGKKLEIKSIDSESGRLWVKECIKTNWTNSVDPYHVELFYLGYVTLKRSRNGTFYYSAKGWNHENVGDNRAINTKQSALKTIRKYYKDFELIDKTKQK